MKDLSSSLVGSCINSHEFYHVCSFCRKIDAEKMKEIEGAKEIKEEKGRREKRDEAEGTLKDKASQELYLFSPICFQSGQTENACTKLFGNGEGMRNLCGLKIQDGKIVNSIGEFDFWQQALKGTSTYEGKLVLPLYCDVNAPAPVLAAENNAILHQLFQIKFPKYPHMPTVNASNILGSDFSNFSLIDVPGDGNCGISAVLVASGQMGKGFSISTDGHLSLTSEQKRQMMELRERATECIPLLHDHSIEISNRLGIDGSWIGGEDFAFIARAIGRPIILIQPATEGARPYTMTQFTEDGNEAIVYDRTPEQLLEHNHDTVFIYFNGINHFQALKRNESYKPNCSLQ